MRHYLYVLTLALSLVACGDDDPSEGSSSSSTSSSSSGSGAPNSTSEEAFRLTLYPILRENCSVCHTQSGAGSPSHADSSLSTAHSAALSVVNFNSPASSRIVDRLRDDEHMCWINCDEAADAVETAIEDWSDVVNGGSLANSCAPTMPRDLVLLGDLPFVKSISSMFGPWVTYGRNAPDSATKLFSQKGTVANTSLLNTRMEWAAHVTEAFQRRAAQLSGCMQADRGCAENYIAKAARRAFKRPVDSVEVQQLMDIFDEGATSSFTYGIKLAMQAILVSPSFNHRTEYGEMDSEGHFQLTDHEYASTLSFLLTDALPDEELVEAADSGKLSSPDEREKQARRLLSSEETKDSVETTLLAAWNLGNIFGKVKDPGAFPEYSPLLAAQMYEETRLFLRKHLWEGKITDVLSSRTSFINAELADLYGVPFPGSNRNEFVEVEFDDDKRAGILTQASVLTSFARTDETSVVARGLFVNGPLLCLPRIPPPPEDLISEIEQQLSADSTEAERAEFRAETAPCKNCHSHFDAYGLMFEQYDGIGKFRATDEKGQPIHASTDLTNMADFHGNVSGPVEFADMLAGRDEFVQCVTRHFLAYGTGENGIQRNQCDVTNITNNLDNRSSLTDIIQAIAKSPTLSTRVSEEN